MNRFYLFSPVFPARSHAAPDMALCFVVFQNAAHLAVELRIDIFQPFGDIFMYRTFADPEFACRTAHGCLVFYDIFPEFHRAVFNNAFQWAPP